MLRRITRLLLSLLSPREWLALALFALVAGATGSVSYAVMVTVSTTVDMSDCCCGDVCEGHPECDDAKNGVDNCCERCWSYGLATYCLTLDVFDLGEADNGSNGGVTPAQAVEMEGRICEGVDGDGNPVPPTGPTISLVLTGGPTFVEGYSLHYDCGDGFFWDIAYTCEEDGVLLTVKDCNGCPARSHTNDVTFVGGSPCCNFNSCGLNPIGDFYLRCCTNRSCDENDHWTVVRLRRGC